MRYWHRQRPRARAVHGSYDTVTAVDAETLIVAAAWVVWGKPQLLTDRHAGAHLADRGPRGLVTGICPQTG
jgi:hypothetical protein